MPNPELRIAPEDLRGLLASPEEIAQELRIHRRTQADVGDAAVRAPLAGLPASAAKRRGAMAPRPCFKTSG